MLRLAIPVFLGLFLSLSFVSRAGAAEPPATHVARQIRGWTVHVDRRLLEGEDAAQGRTALDIIDHQLDEVASAVAMDRLRDLQKVVIHVDLDHPLKNLQYHPDAGWLEKNGYDRDLAKKVHCPSVRRLIAIRHQQPWAMLHELAHAYHDQVLGFESPEIKAAWQRYVESGRGRDVLHIDGRTQSHYALTNHKEYFAEMSEAYFGMNDFFPFNRAELARDERDTFEMLEKVWGKHAGRK
jgi:hypothetical protein